MKIEKPEEIIIKNEPYWDAISSAVYVGGVTNLVPADFLKWRSEGEEILPYEELSLAEIKEQWDAFRSQRDDTGEILTVFVETMLHGEIYQIGNWDDGCWYEYGKTNGIA